MKKIIITAIVLVSIIVPLAILGGRQVQTLWAGCQFIPGSMENKSAAEIERAALDYACANFKSANAPRVRLNRRISPKEFMTFFGGSNDFCQDQKLALVILEGDFESLNTLSPLRKPPSTKFVGLLFNLRLGEPIDITGSKTGEGFAEILNDPSLPPRTSQLAPVPEKLPACMYGQIAPTVMPPNR
ncbi:MAG: hypothetical protein HY741_24845 [Chloroflexi bacterium]|nr:hypothetical protein [Chloroflexota bacterium]